VGGYPTAELALDAAVRCETTLSGATHIYKADEDAWIVEDDGIERPHVHRLPAGEGSFGHDFRFSDLIGDEPDFTWPTGKTDNTFLGDWCDVDPAFDLLEGRADEATIASAQTDDGAYVALMGWRGARA
jgi:hypothetical protein